MKRRAAGWGEGQHKKPTKKKTKNKKKTKKKTGYGSWLACQSPGTMIRKQSPCF